VKNSHKYSISISPLDSLRETEDKDLNMLLESLSDLAGKSKENLRILHIGNIANNAYLAARSERRLGIDSHVISLDYTHIMGSPEWEHCRISRQQSEHFSQDFTDCSCEFSRPNWFHSGSTVDVLETIQQHFNSIDPANNIQNFKWEIIPKSQVDKFRNTAISFGWRVLRPIGRKVIPIKFRAKIIGGLVHKFRKMSQIDLNPLFYNFDIVNFYGSSPSLLANSNIQFSSQSKFVSTEHGTLRDYIFADYPLSVDTKSGYELSKVIFVTNQDCLPIAKSMGNPIVVAMPHPVNDEQIHSLRNLRRTKIQQARKRILVPSRHSLTLDIDRGKGNETVYELIKSMAEVRDDLKFTLIAWGDNVKSAKELLSQEESQGIVEWIDVVSRPLLKEMMAESLCLLDQFKIEAYGAVTVDAIGLGVPVITAHNCKNDFDYFGSCAPVLSAINSEEILATILKIEAANLSDETLHFEYSCSWYDNHLSEIQSLRKRLDGYAKSYRGI
jgi:hypothetical protein